MSWSSHVPTAFQWVINRTSYGLELLISLDLKRINASHDSYAVGHRQTSAKCFSCSIKNLYNYLTGSNWKFVKKKHDLLVGILIVLYSPRVFLWSKLQELVLQWNACCIIATIIHYGIEHIMVQIDNLTSCQSVATLLNKYFLCS